MPAFVRSFRTNVARADAAEATIESYLREARFFAAYLAGQNLSIRDVGPQEVREWVRSLVEAGLMPTTIGLKISAIRRLLDAVVDAGILAANPAKGVSGPRDKRITGAAATRTLSLDEARALIAAAASHRNPIVAERDRALVALLIGHGLRSVELTRLYLSDVDLDAKTIVAHGKVRDRIVHLRADSAEALRAVVARRTVDGAGPHEPVFVAASHAIAPGKRLARRGIRFVADRAFAKAGFVVAATTIKGRARPRAAMGAKTAARAAGSRVPTVHGLRASCATLAMLGGAEILHISADLGHSDIRTTQRYFAEHDRRKHNSALHIAVEL